LLKTDSDVLRSVYVRGYCGNPGLGLPPRQTDGKLDVGGAVGKNGLLTVIRDEGKGEPYNGQVELVSGEIAEDLTRYFAASEQMPTILALGVLVDVDGSVKAAGGYLVQLMPGIGVDDDSYIEKLEQRIKTLPPVTAMIDSGADSDGIIAEVLDGFDYNILDRRQPAYKCFCSRKRVENALIATGAKELQAMIDEQDGAEVECNFCDRVYRFSGDELRGMTKPQVDLQ